MSTAIATRRLFVLAFLVVVVALAASFDHPSTTRRPAGAAVDAPPFQIGVTALTPPDAPTRAHAMPVALPLESATSTWFCGGGSGKADSPLALTLLLTNRAAADSATTITVRSETGSAKVRKVMVPGYGTLAMRASDVLAAPWVAAVVESIGGGVVADQRLGNADRATVAQCASGSSASWYFAGGDTERGSSEKLVLFNPFQNLVTADVSFLTPDGLRQPQSVQGIPVSAGSVKVIDVADVENRRSDLASMVTTRMGRLVVWRAQTFDGSGPVIDGAFPPSGISAALGSPAALSRFTLPTAVTGQGVAPRLILSNPGTADSTVRLTITPDDPATNGQPTPITVKVPSSSVHVLGVRDFQQVPAGVPFTIRGTATGGPIVAELWLDGADPAVGHGSFATSAIPVSAPRWVVSPGLETPALDQLGVVAPGRAASFTLQLVDQGRVLSVAVPKASRRVAAGGRISLDLVALLAGHPGATLVVTADVPVVVSRLQAGAGQRGLVSATAVPVAGGFALP